MITKAAIVNNDYIVSKEIEYIYDNQISVNCNAILMSLMAGSPDEVAGGTMYTTGCPSLVEVGMIIAAKLNKVVYSRDPIDSDEMCAIQLLKDNNIEAVCNPNIIL
jgi:deoxycytidylate deaminase